MVFSVSVDKRLSFGNQKGKIFTVTDAQAAGSDAKTELRKIMTVLATNSTDNADTMREREKSGTEGTVTLTPGTNDDDGKMMALGF